MMVLARVAVIAAAALAVACGQKGPPLARIDHLTVTWRPLTGRYTGFSIRYAEFDP